MSYVQPPRRIPVVLRAALFFVERKLGKRLLANRILAWYPKALVGSGIMEALVAHGEPGVPRRLLGLIRVYTSFLVSCPFCVDLNSRDFREKGLSDVEIKGLQARAPLESIASLSPRERAALSHVECICSTPLTFPPQVIETLKTQFSARAVVIIAITCAQVNFWARLIQSFGVPPAGFSAECMIPDKLISGGS